MIAPLNLALWLAFFFFLSRTTLNSVDLIIGKYPSWEEWGIARILVHLTLLSCIFMLRTSWGYRHLSLIFLSFSWSITMSSQISDTIRGNVHPEFFYLDVHFLYSGNFNSGQMVSTLNIPNH